MDKNSKIYIAGHNGLVGSMILAELQKQGYNNIIYKTHDQLDLIDQKSVDEFFRILQSQKNIAHDIYKEIVNSL